MDVNVERQIYIDLRQQLYPLMGKTMEKALESFEKGDWSGCFQACNSIKIIISSEMNKGEKNFFEKITQQLRDLVWASMGKDYSRDGKVRIEKDIALQKVPGLMETYLQLLFQEMSNQGIWFPKSNKHETFQDLILEETFGLEPEKATDKIKKLSESMTSKEILELLPRQEVEKLSLKEELKNVLQE